jgi:hypothetical protein
MIASCVLGDVTSSKMSSFASSDDALEHRLAFLARFAAEELARALPDLR